MPDTDPLLPYHTPNSTANLNLLDHQKLHSYHVLRALLHGYLPSTEQSVANLRALLASDLLVSTQNSRDITPAGRLLIHDFRSWIRVFIDLLNEKNPADSIQEFLWRVRLSSSRHSLPSLPSSSSLVPQLSSTEVGLDTKAAYDSLRIVTHLLLTNAEFRLFLDDLATIGRQIFSDTSFALSDASRQFGQQIKPSQHDLDAAHAADDVDDVDDVDGDRHENRAPPTEDDVRQNASRVADVARNGLSSTAHEAAHSASENLSRDQTKVLLSRLKHAVLKLRQRPDYSDSLDVLKQLAQRYVNASASAAGEAAGEAAAVAEEDVVENEDFKKTVQQLWAILRSFGDPREWESLEQKFNDLMMMMVHADNAKDPQFQQLLSDVGGSLQEMMANPDSFESAPDKIDELTEKSKQSVNDQGSDLRRQVNAFLTQAKRTLRTVSDDRVISNLTAATKKLHKHACDAYCDQNSSLLTDISHIILPRLIRIIQHIPILRLEMPSPELDLLLENLVLEPGHTVNNSSFLPYRTHVTTRNDVDVLKTHSKKIQTNIDTTFTATVLGLNASASDFGYWFNVHTGLFLPFHFQDEGIASFYLDRRGIDISLDVQVARHRLEQIFQLRGVRVRIHKLNYTIHQTKHRLLHWLLKPFLKHLLRRSLEKQFAQRIVRAASDLNRELVFARERLRATRVAGPSDLTTFVRAVLARGTGLTSAGDDTQANVDVGGVFKGVYSPRSLVRQWHEETERSEMEIRQGDQSRDDGDGDGDGNGDGDGRGKTWRNAIFDVSAGYG